MLKKRILSMALIFALALSFVLTPVVYAEQGAATITYVKEEKIPAETPSGIIASPTGNQGSNGGSSGSSSNGTIITSTNPETGDNTNLTPWIMLMLLALAELILCTIISKKRKFNLKR